MIRLRAPESDDAEAVLAVLVARDIADLGRPDFTLGDLRDEWRADDFDLAADAIVAESDGGDLVGYAVVRRRGVAAAVAPDQEGRGIGTRLLQWAEGRERELQHSQHRQWVIAGNERAHDLLRGAGYSVVRSYWRMARSLSDAPEAASPPEVELRPLRPDEDAVALHALDDAAFSPNPDYQSQPPDAFRQEHLQAHDLDPSLSVVAETSGHIAGFLLTRRWSEESLGYVDILAVHPAHQGRRIGTALLQTCFARCAAAGLREAQLGVASDNPRALHLYERVGMTPRFRADTYERPAG